MPRQSRRASVAGAALGWSFLFGATSAFGADLSCVQQAIAWLHSSPDPTKQPHFVFFHAVSLHPNGIAAYTTGELSSANCTRAPYASGLVSCLKTTVKLNALVSDRRDSSYTQPFDVHQPLPFDVDVIPADNLAQVHMRQPGASYDFDPRCLGIDMLIGNDQWGKTVCMRSTSVAC